MTKPYRNPSADIDSQQSDTDTYHNKKDITVDKPRTNQEIRIQQVQVVNHDGAFLGVMKTFDAIQKARSLSLDLVEIVPTETPPICKIMDLGKYLFELKKKKRDNVHKAPPTHEIRLTPNTGDHDILIKAKKALEFLAEGSKVILQFKTKGREARKTDLIKAVANKFYQAVAEKATFETKDDTYILHPKVA